MTKVRIALLAVVVALLAGRRRSRSRGQVPTKTPLPPDVVYELRAQVAAAEGRLADRVHAAEQHRRRTGAVLFAMVVLLIVPGALVGTRPDVPEVVVAAVLTGHLVVAAVALVVALRTRDRRPARG